MTNLLGLPLENALRSLKEMGIEPDILYTVGRHETADGTERVIRVSEDGRRLTVARFPDIVKLDDLSKNGEEA